MIIVIIINYLKKDKKKAGNKEKIARRGQTNRNCGRFLRFLSASPASILKHFYEKTTLLEFHLSLSEHAYDV